LSQYGYRKLKDLLNAISSTVSVATNASGAKVVRLSSVFVSNQMFEMDSFSETVSAFAQFCATKWTLKSDVMFI
jgi:hypothetical protein